MRDFARLTIPQMIAEWRKGCSNSGHECPERCGDCTRALIEAIERRMTEGVVSTHSSAAERILAALGITGITSRLQITLEPGDLVTVSVEQYAESKGAEQLAVVLTEYRLVPKGGL